MTWANNIYTYITQGYFLHDIAGSDISFVWETIPAEIKKDDGFHHVTFESLWYDFRQDGSIVDFINTHKRVILLLDTIWIHDCTEIFAWLQEDVQLKICNLWVWISGVQNKHSIENNDLAIVHDFLPIYEPIDRVHFLQMLNASGSMYIRITNDEVADEILTGEYAVLYAERDIPMTSFGYSGIGWTILIQPSLLVTISQVLQYLQTTNWYGYDLFVHTWPRDVYSQKLIDSLHHTQKLIIIHDQIDDAFLRDTEWEIFKKSNVQWEVQVFFKHPHYDKITTILPEYMYEQIWYATENLAQYLISLQ